MPLPPALMISFFSTADVPGVPAAQLLLCSIGLMGLPADMKMAVEVGTYGTVEYSVAETAEAAVLLG